MNNPGFKLKDSSLNCFVLDMEVLKDDQLIQVVINDVLHQNCQQITLGFFWVQNLNIVSITLR